MKQIDELVKEVLDRRKFYLQLGIKKHTWHDYKKRFKKGTLKHEHKQDILLQSGYRLVEPEMWDAA